MQRASLSLKLRLPTLLRYAALLAAALVLAALLFFTLRGCGFPGETITSGGQQLLGASPGDTFLPFGGRVLAFNGSVLSCYSNLGRKLWEYSVADNWGGYKIEASSTLVALYKGQNLVLLDQKGALVFQRILPQEIRSLRVGVDLVAIEMPGAGRLQILGRQGTDRDSIDLGGAELLDFGFYSQQDMLWALTLDTTGLSFESRLNTYQTGKQQLVTGYVSEEQVYYKPLFFKNDIYILGTKTLEYIKDQSQSVTSSTGAFGWQYKSAFIGQNEIAIVLSKTSEGESPQSVRLLRGGSSEDLHLPQGCLYVCASESQLVSVSQSVVSAVPYSQSSARKELQFKTPIDRCLADVDGKLIVASVGESVYLYRLL
ncbi:MAG: DUF5711 family protein [Christensenellaceae bacterium]|jgi:hypothetical protein|nr:DUF5711 family protein [Christensenellaceae bacterium]